MARKKGQVCPHCGQTHPERVIFCPNTGLRVRQTDWYCPICGAKILPGADSCHNCGSWLDLSVSSITAAVSGAEESEAPPPGQTAEPLRKEEIAPQQEAPAVDQKHPQAAPIRPLENGLPCLAAIFPREAVAVPEKARRAAGSPQELPGEPPLTEQALQTAPQSRNHAQEFQPTVKAPPVEQSAAPHRVESKAAVQRVGSSWLAPVLMMAVCILGGAMGTLLWRGSSVQGAGDQLLTQTVVFIAQSVSLTSSATPTQTTKPPATQTAMPTGKPSNTPRPSSTSTRTPSRTVRPTHTPTADVRWEACPDSYPSRLHLGGRGYVSFDPPLKNNVREQPGLASPLVGQLQTGEEFDVLDGPACEDSMVWWFVRSRRTDLAGWTSEGDFVDYWLVPIPD